MQKILGVTCILLALLALSGCDETGTQNAEESLKRAAEKRAAGKARAAVIEVKNVLQKNPESAEARLLLAKIYLDVGDGASAEKEVNKAEELGANALEILEVRGRSWLLQQNAKAVIEKIPYEENASAAMRRYAGELRGEAFRLLGRRDKAVETFNQARAAYRQDINEERPHLKLTEPEESVPALVGLAKIAIAQKDWDTARTHLDRALAVAPDSAETQALKGQFEFDQKNFAGAEEAYKKAFAAQPFKAGYQIRIAHAQVAQEKYDEAIGNLDAVLKAFPENVLSLYLRAAAAFRLQKYEEARSYIDRLFRKTDNHIPSYLIAGSTSYALGQLEQANRYLTRYVKAVPHNVAARKLLSNIQIKLGRPGEALATLRPVTDESTDDVALLSLIGTAAVASGDLDTGYRYLQKASVARPDDAKLKAQTAVIQIARGDTESGLRSLEEALSEQSDLGRIEQRLILTYIREKKFDEAVTAARRLQERQADKPAGFILEGLAEFSRKDMERANAAFEKALTVRPGDPTAAHNLALLHLSNGKTDEARESYKSVFKHFPDDQPTLLRLARLENRLNNQDEALRLLNKVLEKNPDSTVAKSRVARILIETGKPGKGLALAQEALRGAPDDVALLESIAVAQMNTQRFADAVLTFKRLTEISPESIETQFSLARAAFFAGNAPRAKEALAVVLAKIPEHTDSLVLRAQIALFERDTETVRTSLPVLKKIDGTETLVALIETNLALAENKPDDAITSLEKLIELRDDTNDTLRLAELLWLRGRRDEALKRMNDWLEKYPDDHLSRLKLGQFYMTALRWKEAKRELETVTEAAPEISAAVNNLAFTEYNLGNLEAAEKYARQANKLLPGNASLMDTLGVILLEKGDSEAAVEWLRKAAARPSDAPVTIRYHLAKALAALDRKEEAMETLKIVLDSGVRFDEIDDAKALMKSLNE